MPRMFIAIQLPDDVRNALLRLRIDIPGARWVSPEQLHLTLAFLGDVASADITGLKRQLSSVNASQFGLRFSAPGCFPAPRRARVLWAGLIQEPRLSRLASCVREAVLACGIPLEERSFSPHITLARLKLPAEKQVNEFMSQSMGRIPPFTAGEFILYESRLTSSGAIHTPLETFPLIPARQTFPTGAR